MKANETLCRYFLKSIRESIPISANLPFIVDYRLQLASPHVVLVANLGGIHVLSPLEWSHRGLVPNGILPVVVLAAHKALDASIDSSISQTTLAPGFLIWPKEKIGCQCHR